MNKTREKFLFYGALFLTIVTFFIAIFEGDVWWILFSSQVFGTIAQGQLVSLIDD